MVAPRYGRKAQKAPQRQFLNPCLISVPVGKKQNLQTVQAACDQLPGTSPGTQILIVGSGGRSSRRPGWLCRVLPIYGHCFFVQAPTTLLAQVDSFGGGKVVVNLKAGKTLGRGILSFNETGLFDLETLNSSVSGYRFRPG